MRRLFVLVCSIVFLDGMLLGTLIPLVPGYVDEFDLSKLQARRPPRLVRRRCGAGGIPGGIPRSARPQASPDRRDAAARRRKLRLRPRGLSRPLGLARFVQGFSSTMTWSGALRGSRSRRRGNGEARCWTAFGSPCSERSSARCSAAIAALDPRSSSRSMGPVALALAASRHANRCRPPGAQTSGALSAGARDRRSSSGSGSTGSRVSLRRARRARATPARRRRATACSRSASSSSSRG